LWAVSLLARYKAQEDALAESSRQAYARISCRRVYDIILVKKDESIGLKMIRFSIPPKSPCTNPGNKNQIYFPTVYYSIGPIADFIYVFQIWNLILKLDRCNSAAEMEPSNPHDILDQIRDLDLVDYLASCGISPQRIRGNDFWYLSPLRHETEASFKINRKLNCWYDYGIGKGGNLIDFAIIHQGTSIKELIKNISGSGNLRPHRIAFPETQHHADHKMEIIGNVSLRSDSLMRYIQERRVSISIADEYCREITFKVRDRSYLGIGFANDQGGLELRNPYFKGSSSPKDITSILSGNKEVMVFEGFMDFLTFRTLNRGIGPDSVDFVVLNGISLFGRALPKFKAHEKVSLFLDNDPPGKNLTQYAVSLDPKFNDQSRLYDGHKDLNDWATKIGLKPYRTTRRLNHRQ